MRAYALPLAAAPSVHTIQGYALFSTAVPEYAEYNTAVVAIEGTFDMATRAIVVEDRALGRERALAIAESLLAAA